ncbi:MAG: efflux RND transporter periplasmic adaptor subunit [Bacteroidia bacterium]
MVDRIIEKKKFNTKTILYVLVGISFLLLLLYLFKTNFSKEVKADINRVHIGIVKYGEFKEYIAIDGIVLPIKTIYLDAIEGGRVAEKFVQDGAILKEGEALLKLVNTDLQLDFLQRETQAFDLINNLQNARNNLENLKVNRLNQLAEVEFQFLEAERLFETNKKLFEENLISKQEYLQFKNSYDYSSKRKKLIEKAIVQDSITAYEQMKQMRESYSRMQSNIKLMRQKTEDLIVRAPAAGQLSSFKAEIGELKNKGQNLGQIDVLDGYKIRAQIDEHYINRIIIGQIAEFEINQKIYQLKINAINPQVVNGKFEIDLLFNGEIPKGIKKGQNIQIRLSLGENEKALLVEKGGFYESTSGQWIYVLEKDKKSATKKAIKIGRQNPDFYEIKEGLSDGEEVIISSYQTLGDYDKIIFK